MRYDAEGCSRRHPSGYQAVIDRIVLQLKTKVEVLEVAVEELLRLNRKTDFSLSDLNAVVKLKVETKLAEFIKNRAKP